LRAAMAEFFQGVRQVLQLRLPLSAGRLRAKLYEIGCVLHEQITESQEWLVDIEVEQDQLRQLRRYSGDLDAMIVDDASKRLAGVA
jgi:GTPase